MTPTARNAPENPITAHLYSAGTWAKPRLSLILLAAFQQTQFGPFWCCKSALPIKHLWPFDPLACPCFWLASLVNPAVAVYGLCRKNFSISTTHSVSWLVMRCLFICHSTKQFIAPKPPLPCLANLPFSTPGLGEGRNRKAAQQLSLTAIRAGNFLGEMT